MTERVLRFGPRSAMVGILCAPDGDARADDGRPTVLMWNVGVNHRVGPYRVFVELARALASNGFASLRFDSSGLGDSEARRDSADGAESAELDLRDAMDAITRRTGCTRFVLVGFCSSVDAAHRVAVKDPRVVGAIHIEGYAFPTRGFYRRYPLRMLSRRRWTRRLRHTVDSLVGMVKHRPMPAITAELVYARDYPEWSQFARELAELTKRQVTFLFVYVGLDTAFNYPGQFWQMFATRELERQRIELAYFPDADHTFYELSERHEMLARVLLFMRDRFS